MSRWIQTKYWSSTENLEVMDLVIKNKRGPSSKEEVREDRLWLNRTVLKNKGIVYVAVVKTTPSDALKMVPRNTFKAYLVNRRIKGAHTPDVVKMLYLIPR